MLLGVPRFLLPFMTVCITNFYVGAVNSIHHNVAFDDMVFFKSLLDFWGQQMSGCGNPMSRLFYNGRSAPPRGGDSDSGETRAVSHSETSPSSSSTILLSTPKTKSIKRKVPTHIKVSRSSPGYLGTTIFFCFFS